MDLLRRFPHLVLLCVAFLSACGGGEKKSEDGKPDLSDIDRAEIFFYPGFGGNRLFTGKVSIFKPEEVALLKSVLDGKSKPNPNCWFNGYIRYFVKGDTTIRAQVDFNFSPDCMVFAYFGGQEPIYTFPDSAVFKFVDESRPGIPQHLDDFRFMLGKWKQVREEKTTYEVWKEVTPKYFKAEVYSVSHSSGDTTFNEKIDLESGEGTTVYRAYPAGQNPVPFSLSFMGNDSIAFFNPMHDFPQVISYSKEGDTLLAKVGADQDQDGQYEFQLIPMVKAD